MKNKRKNFLSKILAVSTCTAMVFSLVACGSSAESTSGSYQGSNGIEYTALAIFSSDANVSGKTYASTGTDENAILVTDGNVNFDNITVSRESSDSTGGDNASFYGVGAAILGLGGTTTITNSNITTDAKGGAGAFAYGDGVIKISDTTIETKQSTSGGVHVAGGGTLYATNVTATTAGESSAAIRSDRGGGLLVADGGTYTSNGIGSPAIYSTANIVVKDADLTANNSEAICIEGLNGAYLYNCNLTGNMPSDNEQNDCTWNVILYQSMSGDSKEGNSTFQMQGGTLTAKSGGMFYTTNTESTFILDSVDITYSSDNDFFLKCTGNANGRGWGSSGSNGATSNFTAINQEMEGNVIWDSISKLDMYMTSGSTLKGAFIDDESNAGDGGDGYASLYIDESSTWTVTANSTLTNLYNAGTIIGADGKSVTIANTDGTVLVKGDGAYTITVSNYSTSADVSGAKTITAYEDAQVNNGSQDSGMGGTPGQGGQMPSGEMPSGGPGQGGQMPNGEAPSGDMPSGEMPSGGPGQGGQGGEMPSMADGETPPSKPDSNGDAK